MIDFRIITFLTVCRSLNFTKAADELCITQPAVSQHIHYLEEHFSTKLFEHKGKTISLTPSGERLRKKANSLYNDEKILQMELKENKSVSDNLIFGATLTIAEFIIAKPLSKYIQNNPNAKIKMIMSNTQDLLQNLRNGEINFAIIEGFFPEEEFDSAVYSHEEFVAACSSKKTFTKEKLFVKDLLTENILIREKGSGSRNIFEKVLDVRDLSLQQFHRVTEINSLNAIINLIENDAGISFLYKAGITKQIEENKIKVIKLTDFSLYHDFSFIWNKGSLYKNEYIDIFNQLKD